MKLHLPSRLRAALLSCMAFVSPMLPTLCSGTLIASAVVWSALSPAYADWNEAKTVYTYTSDDQTAAKSFSDIAADATEGSDYTIAFDEGVTYTLTGSINLVTSAEEGSDITGGSLQMTDWGNSCNNAILAGNGQLTVKDLTFGRGTSTIQGTSAENKIRLNVLGSAGCSSWYDTRINVSNAVLNLQQGITLVTGNSGTPSWAARMTMTDTDVILGAAMVTQTVNDTITFNGNCSIDIAGLQAVTYLDAFPDSDVEQPESNGFATSRSGYRILDGTCRGILGEEATLTVKNGETVLATYSNGEDIATALKFVTTDDLPIITSTIYCVTDITSFSWDDAEGATKIVFFDSQVSETSNVYDLGSGVHAVSMEIRDGVTFTTSHNGGTAFWGNGNTFTIKAGGTLITTANDAIGYNNGSTRLVMQGEEGKEALWQLGNRVTTTSQIQLNGNASIVAPEGADLGASGGGDRSGLDLHGGTISVTGLNNVIATNVFTRGDGNASTMDIAESGELTLKYGITNRSGNKAINKTGSGTLIVEGTVAQADGTLNLNAGSLVYRANASVTQGTLSMGANANLTFEARDTLTEHTLTTLSTTGAGGLISIGAGNRINSGSVNISWAKNLLVDGELLIDGNDEGGLTLAYANVGTISGAGSLSANRLVIDNSTRLDWKLGAVSSIGALTMGGTGSNYGTNNSLTLQSGMEISGNATLANGVLTANAALSIGGDLSMLGAATLVSTNGVSVTGSSTLTSGATLGTSISAGQDSITYSDGVNGFLTGGKVYILRCDDISIVGSEGADAELSTLNFTLDGSAVDAARAGTDDTGLYLTIEAAADALYYVNSGSVTMNDHSTATGFVLAEGATLVYKASAAADYAATEGLQSIRSLGGQLSVVNSTGANNLLTLKGAYSDVTLNSKQDSSIQVLGGTVASGSTAALTVHSGATLDLNNDGLVRSAAITVESGGRVAVTGNQRYQGNMRLQGTLVIGQTDALDWNSSGKLTIDGGTVEAGSNRISIDKNSLELHNATIKGAGQDLYGVLDFASSAQKVVVATGTNTVEGMVRVRGTNGVCFDVQGQTDTLSLKKLGLADQTSGLTQGTILAKSGLGTLTVHEASALATVNVLGGTLKLTGTNSITSTTVEDGATLGSTAAGLTLGGSLTLQDGAALDVTNGTIALGAADSTQALTWDGCITLVGADTGSVDLLSGISSITGIDFGSGNTVAAADYIQGASADALLRFTDGTLTFLSSDDSILVIDSAHTYNQTDADNAAVTSIRLAGGTLSMANVAIPSTVTTLDVTAAGGALTGTGTVNTLSFGSVNVNGQLTLQDGATDLTLKTQQLSIGENGSIVLEAGQTLDLTELTPGGAANSGYTRATDALKLTLGKVTGAGTVKLCGASGSIGDDSRIMTRMLSDTATSVAYLSEGALAVNGSSSSVALTIGSSFTVGGEFRLESGAQIMVTTGGALSVNGSINMGHAEVANNNGSLSMSGGSITTDGIGFTRDDHGTGSTFTMSGGTLTINTTAGIASGIGITITGGTLATNGADWGMSNATIGGATISGENTISLGGNTTLTGTLDNSAGKLALSGSVNISDTDNFRTQSTTTGYSDGAKQGFASQDVNYIIAEDGSAEHLSIAEGTTWTVNGEASGSLVDLDDSKAYRVTGVQGTAFYIGTNDVTYDT
ncbi:MAG: beta strand repeat-containing protein, partial [Akkermansia sp.]